MFRSIPQPLDWAKAVYSVALWAVLFWVALATAQAATINLAWNASTGATGYRVYQAETNETAVNLTTQHVTDASPIIKDTGTTTTPPPTTATVSVAEGKTYYFAVKAYKKDSQGEITSGFSNEAGKTVPAATPAPVASFSATPLSGTAPLTVQFTNSSTNATTWSWNFGDGTTSTAQNPSKTYSSAGTYTVTLTATGSGGSNTATRTGYITVTAPSTTTKPTAKFSATPTSGPAPLLVTFTDTSTGTVTSRSWNFGNGQTSTAPSASITYNPNTAGTTTYTATLTVSNSAGSSTTSQTISATAAAPLASFSASPTSGSAPLAVTFTSTSTGTITSYAWDFGDGTTSTVQNPSKTYANAGTYTVSLKVTGPAGSNTKTQTGYITVSQASASTGGLVAAYNFEEASGTTVVDASGQGNHGTISGATRTTSGKFGSALSFDGVNDWVTVNDANSLDLTNGMTLAAWVYPTTTMSGWRTVVLKEEASSGVYYLYANLDTNQPGGIVDTSNNGELVVSGKSQLPVNTWTHLAVTYNGQYQRLYVNGVEVAAQPQTGTMSTSNGALRIGGNSIWNEFFKGRIDEIRVYNQALSATEIKTDMNTAVATSSPPKRLLGEQALGSVSDSLASGTAAAFQTTASVAGLITSLPVYVDSGSTSTNLVAGLYADSNGRPGARLATGTLSSPKAGSWNTVLLPATKVTAGTKYWVAILSTSGTLKFRDRVGTTAQPSETSLRTSLTALPSTWATGTVSANGPLSGYGAGY